VPSAFTPDGDGKNDVFRPIAIGIKQITYFKVFNRWGVLVYSSAKNAYEQSIGWDGTYKGKPQDSAVYVWIVEGVDYLDKKITQKGTVTLIR
jgi:gliding motility-associated-like protein